jgi:hypothetical protein
MASLDRAAVAPRGGPAVIATHSNGRRRWQASERPKTSNSPERYANDVEIAKRLAGFIVADEPGAIVVDFKVWRAMDALMAWPTVRERARDLGPWLFPDGPIRRLAAAIVADAPSDPHTADSPEVRFLVRHIERHEPPTESEGLHLLRLLSDDTKRATQAAVLRWAADRVEAGDASPEWIRARFDAAMVALSSESFE